MNHRLQEGATLVGPLLILLVWYLSTSYSGDVRQYIATPQETYSALANFIQTKEFYIDISYTLGRSFLAIAIALILAIPTALIISFHRSFFVISEFSLDFFRSIPSIAIFPLFLVIFGINDFARIGTAVFVCFWTLLLNIIYGITHVSKDRIDIAKIMGASNIQAFEHVLFWEAIVHLSSGLRQVITISLVMILITEMLISPTYGLGTRIYFTQQTYKIPEMYALIIVTGILGYWINRVVIKLEKKYIHWV